MSRRPPSDTFTRFTSTTPHATSQSSRSSSRPHLNQTTDPQRSARFTAAPEGETAAQKVARLRQANRIAKERAQLSPVDRLLARGRFWADFAHRATTYGLLAITGVSSVVAVYGLVSLVSHNRRQKRAWIEREMDRLHEARQAFLRGEADAEQLHLLEQERAGEEIAKKYKEDKEKRKADGIFGKVKGTFGTFLGSGDKGVETVRQAELVQTVGGQDGPSRDKLLSEGWLEGEVAMVPTAKQESHIPGVGLDEKGRPVPLSKMEKTVRKVDDQRRTGEKAVTDYTGIARGPLDVLADNLTNAVIPQVQQNQSWWSWATGGSKSS